MSITYLLPFIKNNIIYDAKVLIGSEVIKSAYHLREKFAKIFRKKIRSCFSHRKKERDWVVPFTKYSFPLFQERKHRTLVTHAKV